MRNHRTNREILKEIEFQIHALRQEVRTFRIDEAIGDYEMAKSFDDLMNKIREADTVSKSNNIAMREELKLLRAGKNDPAKIDEAIALIEAIMADDSAVLTENTPAEGEGGAETPPFNPSGNQ